MRPVFKNVMMPKTRRPTPPTSRKYPFEEMGVGDMFFLPDKSRNNLATYASTQGKRLGRKFATKLAWMKGSDDKGWQPAEEGQKGAVLGIGVWRTK